MSFPLSVSNFPYLKTTLRNFSYFYHSLILVKVTCIFQPCSTKKSLHVSVGLAVPGPGRQMPLSDKHRQPESSRNLPQGAISHLWASCYWAFIPFTQANHPRERKKERLHLPCPDRQDLLFIWLGKNNFLKNTSLLRCEIGLPQDANQHVIDVRGPVLVRASCKQHSIQTESWS